MTSAGSFTGLIPQKPTQPPWKSLVPSVPLRDFRIKKVELTGPKCCRPSKSPTHYPVSFFLWLQKPSLYCWGWQCAQLWKCMLPSLAYENVWGDRWRHHWLRFWGKLYKGRQLDSEKHSFLASLLFPSWLGQGCGTGVFRGFLTWGEFENGNHKQSMMEGMVEVWTLSHHGATNRAWDCPPRLTFLRGNNHLPLVYSNILTSCSTQPGAFAKVMQLACSKAGIWNEVFHSWKVISLTTVLIGHSEHCLPATELATEDTEMSETTWWSYNIC